MMDRCLAGLWSFLPAAFQAEGRRSEPRAGLEKRRKQEKNPRKIENTLENNRKPLENNRNTLENKEKIPRRSSWMRYFWAESSRKPSRC